MVRQRPLLALVWREFVPFKYPAQTLDRAVIRTVAHNQFLVFIGECVALHLAIIKYQHDIVRWFEYSLEFSQRFLVLQPVRSLRACDHLNAVIW